MQRKLIIVSVGNTTQIFSDGKVYGDNIVELDFHCEAGKLPKLNIRADSLPVEGTAELENFRAAINMLLKEK